jgi:hypothetical protein
MGVLSAISAYKTRQISRRRMQLNVLFWLCVFVGLMLIEPLYNALIRANLTDSGPLSIFDIVLLTFILLILFLIKKVNESNMRLKRRMSILQENLAIQEELKSQND